MIFKFVFGYEVIVFTMNFTLSFLSLVVDEIENANDFSLPKRKFAREDLPEPEGAEIIKYFEFNINFSLIC